MTTPTEQPEALQTVAWRWIPSEVWGEHVVTCHPGQAIMARETGLVEVEELVRKSDAIAAREADREAMRMALEALKGVEQPMTEMVPAGSESERLIDMRDAIKALEQRVGGS